MSLNYRVYSHDFISDLIILFITEAGVKLLILLITYFFNKSDILYYTFYPFLVHFNFVEYSRNKINGTPVERVDSFRYFGVHVTHDQTYHINTLSSLTCSLSPASSAGPRPGR